MSRLDFEFEQVLGSWLDHCAESLSLQQLSTIPGEGQSPDDDANNNSGGRIVKVEDRTNKTATKTSPSTSSTTKLTRADAWIIEASTPTIDRFRGMIVDNMEKLREIFRVLLYRLRKLLSSSGGAGRRGTTTTTGADATVDGDDDGDDDVVASSGGGANAASSSPQHKQFVWLTFDCFMQAVPIVAVPWCTAPEVDFAGLVERNMPWTEACVWCDTMVASWEKLFRNVDPYFGERISNIARQRRTSVMIAENIAAEKRARELEDDANASSRDASSKELAELNELAQRLIAALNKHKPSDGRAAVVKLEGAAQVKQEAAQQLQAAAAQLAGIGDTADAALDVDSEYTPTFVAGANMHGLVKDERGDNNADDAVQEVSAPALGQGGRRAPRKRPR